MFGQRRSLTLGFVRGRIWSLGSDSGSRPWAIDQAGSLCLDSGHCSRKRTIGSQTQDICSLETGVIDLAYRKAAHLPA